MTSQVHTSPAEVAVDRSKPSLVLSGENRHELQHAARHLRLRQRAARDEVAHDDAREPILVHGVGEQATVVGDRERVDIPFQVRASVRCPCRWRCRSARAGRNRCPSLEIAYTLRPSSRQARELVAAPCRPSARSASPCRRRDRAASSLRFAIGDAAREQHLRAIGGDVVGSDRAGLAIHALRAARVGRDRRRRSSTRPSPWSRASTRAACHPG